MRPVRFTRGHDHGSTRYLVGEAAGFPDEVAARLVEIGAAVYVDVSAAPSETPPSVPPPPAGDSGGAAPLLSTLTPESPPDPAAEAAAIQADNVSRNTPKSERKRR